MRKDMRVITEKYEISKTCSHNWNELEKDIFECVKCLACKYFNKRVNRWIYYDGYGEIYLIKKKSRRCSDDN